MTYAFIQDVPADEEIYAKIRAELGEEPPAGLIAHVVIRQPQGLRYVDVWHSKEQWARFQEDAVEPAVGRVLDGYGIPHDHSLVHVEEIDVIHTWVGAA